MAHWIDAQGPSKLVKNSTTCLLCDVTNRKLHTQIKYIYFLIETRRLAESVEGWSSSLAIEAGELLTNMCRPMYRPARSFWIKTTKTSHQTLINHPFITHLETLLRVQYRRFCFWGQFIQNFEHHCTCLVATGGLWWVYPPRQTPIEILTKPPQSKY